MTSIPPEPTAARKGILVIAVLAMIFFGILFLLFIYSGKHSDRPAAAAPSPVYVLPTSLRIRKEPSTTADVLNTVRRGEKLSMTEDQGNWAKVTLTDGSDGWAERSYLESGTEHDRRLARVTAIRRLPPLEAQVESDSTVYAGPGVFYPVIGKLDGQSRVRVYTRDHDFFAVEFGGGIGYAEVDTIDVTASGGVQFEVASSHSPTGSAGQLTGTMSGMDSTAESKDRGMDETMSQEEMHTRPQAEMPAPATDRPVYAVVPTGGTPPVVVDQVNPRYPTLARRAGVEGPVVLRAIIRRDGSVEDVEVLRDLPMGLGEAARRAVERWRFRPARFHG
ncbi:MAG: TonB family protein, partial [Acidobacteriota bacterium]